MDLSDVFTSRMLNEQYCKSDRMFNSTYNGDIAVPPFAGIMFEISSFTDINVNTFEIDVRWDMKPTDLSIQVFTIEGYFADRFNDSSVWELIASTKIVPAPEGNSGIIPVADFTSVTIKSLEVRSFYITMKGPYIDHTVYGLQKTGDFYTKNDDIQLYVGSGFTSDNFPGKIDATLDPQFAGIVYYTKAYQCDDSQARSTSIVYQFLLESNGVDDAFVLRYNAALDAAVDRVMTTSKSLKDFVTDFGLQKSTGATTTKNRFTGECPIDWTNCARIVLTSTINFSHMNALETSRVQSEMYCKENSSVVIEAIKYSLAKEINIANVGIESASAQLQVVVSGVPVGELMDDVQIRYFEDTTQLFLDKFNGKMAVFSVSGSILPVQSENSMRLRHLGKEVGNGKASISFDVNGAYPVGTSVDDYIDALSNACRWQEDVYLAMLEQNGVRPGDVSAGDRLEYFQGISSISCHVRKIEQTPTKPTTIEKVLVRNIIIGVVVNMCIVAATIFIIGQIQKTRKKSADDEKYREDRRQERRLRRMERSKQESPIDDRSIDMPSRNDSDAIDAERAGQSDEIDAERAEQRSGNSKFKEKENKKRDSTSSISTSLHTLDLDNTPNQTHTSNRNLQAGKRVSSEEMLGVNRSNPSKRKALSRAKSMSPSSGIRRVVDPSQSHRSLEMGQAVTSIADANDIHRRDNKHMFNRKKAQKT